MSSKIENKIHSEERLPELPEWDDTGESLLKYEWAKVRYEGP
jgi:hypothetical protein